MATKHYTYPHNLKQTTMSKMKQLAIELQNEVMDAELIELHDNLMNNVHESGLPLWMLHMYEYNLMQEEQEVESRNFVEFATMDYMQFKNSEQGENFHHFYGDWPTSYLAYCKERNVLSNHPFDDEEDCI